MERVPYTRKQLEACCIVIGNMYSREVEELGLMESVFRSLAYSCAYNFKANSNEQEIVKQAYRDLYQFGEFRYE